jgi:hypothetical protein
LDQEGKDDTIENEDLKPGKKDEKVEPLEID